jgi:hypothetical protein
MVKPILFLDLNGTCVDDWESLYGGVRAIFQYFNKPIPPLAEYVRAIGFNTA